MGKKGDGTRKLIRERAAGLFAQRGFKNVTMNDICQVTGLSRGGLYRHYDSTKQIFSEIVDELMQAQDNELSEKMRAGLPATQILDEILERYRREMMDGEASLSVAIYEYYSGSSATDDRENLLSKQYEYSVEMWSAFISYGIKRGEFKETDARELIDILLFAYQGVRMYSTIMPLDEQIPARIIHHVKRTLTM
ncbi:TetR/AcrR family transcriptional regulator [Eubacterium sp. An3]|uniref:TetR/AcrR family transcriptional regulator n=1 Tax=Eubacterium sp. An3 TaxID=1965628 RepID=UPI000B3AA717|nr:TetR/AcrR family transcriptional regulator [Eubacterium sp. An3]OUO27977.1 TetR family transcriptional regulator [Eubacterium sp. An3]